MLIAKNPVVEENSKLQLARVILEVQSLNAYKY